MYVCICVYVHIYIYIYLFIYPGGLRDAHRGRELRRLPGRPGGAGQGAGPFINQ